MKMLRTKLLTSFAVIPVLAMNFAEAEVAGVGAAPAGATAEALAAAGEAAAAETRKRAPAANFLPIVRGRLPLLFVHAVRFDAVINPMGNKDIATKFATSVGKVFDIKKGRNFAYVNADYKPSAEDFAAAEAWITQVGASNAKGLAAVGDKDLLQKVLDQYKAGGVATAEDAAKLEAAKVASRPVKTEAKPKTAKLPATAGEGVQTAGATGTADDLLE